MTRRERLTRKLEKRAEWAEKAEGRAADRFATADRICEHVPFGQPILVGHYSERHARADQKRIHNNMDKGCEEARKANYHRGKAAGLSHQLKRTIFSDDEDAIAELEARIAKNEAKSAEYKKINAAWRKGGAAAVLALGYSETLVSTIEKTIQQCSWDPKPYPAFETTNLRARIRADRDRIEQIKKQQERSHKAAEADGGILIEGDTYVRVTFPEKPDRDVLTALKAAGFRWTQGSWYGAREKLPQDVRA